MHSTTKCGRPAMLSVMMLQSVMVLRSWNPISGPTPPSRASILQALDGWQRGLPRIPRDVSQSVGLELSNLLGAGVEHCPIGGERSLRQPGRRRAFRAGVDRHGVER